MKWTIVVAIAGLLATALSSCDTTEPVSSPQVSGDVTLSKAKPGCARKSAGLPPLDDLGAGSYLGLQGGLYPDGLNTRPAAHTAGGVAIAETIVPLDINGVTNSVSGRIVLMSIGMSNTSGEFLAFQSNADTIQGKNPLLVLVNAAQGGADIDEILDSNDIYWTQALDELTAVGLGPKQVQAVWFKEAEDNPMAPPDFPGYPDQLKEKFKTVMGIIKQKFPNVRLCYLSSRIYGNYGITPLNPEPFAWYGGWSVKRLIEDQMNGDPALAYSGADAIAPWLSWSAYIWADGVNPRSDGLTWICPDDYEPDGNHPSRAGRLKVSSRLIQFFTTDETTVPWFME